jgi:putative Holliday junction resolvase
LANADQERARTSPQNLSGRILAVDFGLKRVGLAVSDPMQIIAQPLETITYKSRQDLVNRLVAIVRENEVVKVVIGLPRHMDGSEGEMAKAVRRLIDQLARALTMPIVAWDERLSSVQAERALRELGVSYRDKNRGNVDRMAAIFILQSYLDRKP